MTDNTTLNPGTGGDVVRTIDRAGVETQVVALDVGGAGAESLVTSANPLPVMMASAPLPTGSSTAALQTTGNTALASILSALGGTLGIGGTVAVSNLPATQAVSGTVGISGTVPVSGTFWQATQPISGTVTANAGSGTFAVSGPLTDTQLRATAVPVSGTVTANAGSGTFAVSGPLTDTQLRATAVPVSGTVTANAGSGTFAVSGPLTDTQLRASAVPVSGPMTDTQLRATAVPVSGTFWQATQPVSGTVTANLGTIAGVATETTLAALNADVTASGTITTQNLVPAGAATAGSAVAITPAGRGGLTVQVTGTYTGALSLQGTVDGTNWITIGGTTFLNVATGALSATIASATQGIFQTEVTGFAQVRLSALAAVTGTATVSIRATNAPPSVAIDAALPTGANNIGTVGLAAGISTVGNVTRQSGFTDSSTALAANATFTGTGRATTGANYRQFAATAFADQAGTLFIDLSVDTGTTYRQIASVAVTAGVAQQLAVFVTGAAGAATLYRVRFTNGATLQTAFQISSAYVA